MNYKLSIESLELITLLLMTQLEELTEGKHSDTKGSAAAATIVRKTFNDVHDLHQATKAENRAARVGIDNLADILKAY